MEKEIRKIEKWAKKVLKSNKNSFLKNFKKLKKIKVNWKTGVVFSVVLFGLTGLIFGAFEYNKISEIIREAKKLQEEENYGEAIKKFGLAQASWPIEKLGIKKDEIKNEIKKNEKLFEDKKKYEEGLNNFNSGYLNLSINLLSELSEDSFYYQKAQTKTEEARRKIVEGELSQEKIAREKAEERSQQEEVAKVAAEIKAKQEEYQKNLKIQEIASKEERERIMNADNDGDGLTYRRELELGTSNWDTDSDNDEITDDKDLHPTGEGRWLAQYFEWEYDGTPWTWNYSIHEDWYEYYKSKPRVSHGLEYVTENDPFIKEVAKMLKEGANKEGYSVSLFIASFVQGLPYVTDDLIALDDYPKYPIETFIERNGDCEDTSYLAASLVNASGYGSALIKLPGHMAIAIKATSSFDGYYYELDDGRYYFLETTNETFGLGDVAPENKYVRAEITKISDGKTFFRYLRYEKPCNGSQNFFGYYYSGDNYYSDSLCNDLVSCVSYRNSYINPQTLDYYSDNNCTQRITSY